MVDANLELRREPVEEKLERPSEAGMIGHRLNDAHIWGGGRPQTKEELNQMVLFDIKKKSWSSPDFHFSGKKNEDFLAFRFKATKFAEIYDIPANLCISYLESGHWMSGDPLDFLLSVLPHRASNLLTDDSRLNAIWDLLSTRYTRAPQLDFCDERIRSVSQGNSSLRKYTEVMADLYRARRQEVEILKLGGLRYDQLTDKQEGHFLLINMSPNDRSEVIRGAMKNYQGTVQPTKTQILAILKPMLQMEAVEETFTRRTKSSSINQLKIDLEDRTFSPFLRNKDAPRGGSKFKTSKCRFGRKCTWGLACSFEHEPEDIELFKEENRRPTCHKWDADKSCQYGSKCRFVHIGSGNGSGN